MNGVMGIALSGLNTQAKRIGVSAQNVANMVSTGVRSDPPAVDDEGYVPQRVLSVEAPGGGARAERVPVSPPSVPVYDPGHPDADGEGVVPRANVSLEREMVTQMEARRAYEANLRVIETVDEMTGALLDIDS